MRTKIFVIVLGSTLGIVLGLASPALAVPPCWSIGASDCNAQCFSIGAGTCSSWSLGTCSSSSAPFTYVCTNGQEIHGWCSGCDDGGGGGSCFLAGTEITLAEGGVKPIESIEAGDVVLAWDETSGEMKPDTVRQVHEPVEVDLYLVVNGSLRLTPTHPVLSDGEWVKIGQLRPGDSLTAADGAVVPIESIETVEEKVTVYNFAVNPYGTYVAGGVIVHNKKLPVKEAEPEAP